MTDYRLWLVAQIIQRREAIQDLIRVACDRAESESDALMPGFTHLQPAQTVRWGHWMMCHATSWQRDDQRLRDMMPRIAQLPLGSGALAGNPFLVDRQFLAKVCCRDIICHTHSVHCAPLHACTVVSSFSPHPSMHSSFLNTLCCCSQQSHMVHYMVSATAVWSSGDVRQMQMCCEGKSTKLRCRS